MPKGESSSRLGRPSAASTTWTRTGSGNSTPVRGVCRSTWSAALATWPAGSGKPPARRRVHHTGRVAPALTGTTSSGPALWRSWWTGKTFAWATRRRKLPLSSAKTAIRGRSGEILGGVRLDPRQPRRPRGATRGDLGAGRDVRVGDVVVGLLLPQASSTSHWRPERRSAPRPFVLQEGSGLNVAAIRVSLPGAVVTHRAFAIRGWLLRPERSRMVRSA